MVVMASNPSEIIDLHHNSLEPNGTAASIDAAASQQLCNESLHNPPLPRG